MEEDKKIDELEGKKLDDNQVGKAAGGMLNTDEYERNPEFYARYGIIWERNFWSKDKYSIYGVSVNAAEADKILDKSIAVHRQLSKEELHDLGITGF